MLSEWRDIACQDIGKRNVRRERIKPMGLYLNPGNDAFQISVHDDIYVDKTGLIAFVNGRLGKRKRFLCVSRPRRFGKSMAAEMLAAYYGRECDSHALFEGLEITKDISYQEHLNCYDVIFLNIQQLLGDAGSPEKLVAYIQHAVLEELRQLYGEYIDEGEKRLPIAFAKIYAGNSRANKGFVFIIDEWDCIFREAAKHTEAQKAYLDFLKDLFKDRTYVKLAYMTGILPIKKYGTHSALNIFDEFSMTNPLQLAKYVGFVEPEVKALCKTYGMRFSEAKKWYDGYRFKGAAHVYNPKSIVDAVTAHEYMSYWSNTETYEALKIYIDLDMDGLKESIVSMLTGAECVIDTGSFQNDMTTFQSRDDVLTLLIHLGYLAYDAQTRTVFIPNEEVRQEFIRAIKNGRHTELARMIQVSDQLLRDTINMNAQAVARLIEDAHSAATAPTFYNNEQALRSVIRFAYISAVEEYKLIQELPSGTGCADVVFLPKKHSKLPVMIVELKWNHSAESAIEQIKDRNYPQMFEGYGGDVLLVGINYDQKTKKHGCVIEKYHME